LFKVMLKYGLILFVICFIASGFLSGVFMLTSPKIEAQKAKEKQEALLTVLPLAMSFKEVSAGGGPAGEVLYYIGYADKASTKAAGYVFTTSAKGYSSVIEIMAGIDLSGNLTGIKILTQAETPGLGARVDEVLTDKTLVDVVKRKKVPHASLRSSAGSRRGRQKADVCGKGPKEPWFQKQFRGKTIEDLVVVKQKTDKNIQSITGATITSEAVTKAVKEKAEEIYKLISEANK